METIKDIVQEMRERCIDKNHSPNLWEYIDRIEAAYKHEADGYKGRIKLWSDRADELRRKCDEQYAELKRKREAVTDCNHFNGAKLREAVETALLDLESHGCDEDSYEYLNERFGDEDRDALPVQLHKKYKEALAVPRRNCDVGTASDMAQRFNQFCQEHRNLYKCCDDCPLLRRGGPCEFEWSQMTYEEGETDEQ